MKHREPVIIAERALSRSLKTLTLNYAQVRQTHQCTDTCTIKKECLREAGTISSVDPLRVNKKLSSCLTVFKRRALVCTDNISPYWFSFILDLWKTCGTASCGCFRTLNCLGCSFPWNQFSQSCFECGGGGGGGVLCFGWSGGFVVN